MKTPAQRQGPVVFCTGHGQMAREWGTEEILVTCEHYSMKKITMIPRKQGGLQIHWKKDESGHVLRGSGVVEYDPGDGSLSVHWIKPGDTFRIPPGAVHRITSGIEGLTYIETSTPHYNDRFHVEDSYGIAKPTGGLPSTKPSDVTTTPPGSGLHAFHESNIKDTPHEVPSSNSCACGKQKDSREELKELVWEAITELHDTFSTRLEDVERLVREHGEQRYRYPGQFVWSTRDTPSNGTSDGQSDERGGFIARAKGHGKRCF